MRPDDVSSLATSLVELQARQERIEEVILKDPAKALEIPLLRNEIQAVRTSPQEQLATTRAEVDRIYDINKWLLGIIGVSVPMLGPITFVSTRGAGRRRTEGGIAHNSIDKISQDRRFCVVPFLVNPNPA